MKKLITLCSILLLPLLLLSQSWFNEYKYGTQHDIYVVTLDGDTLHGKLNYENPAMMAGSINFQEEGAEEAKRYKAKDLKGFYFEDQFWESLKFNDGSLNLTGPQEEYYFLYPIKKGKLSVYEQYYAEVEGLLENILAADVKTQTWLKKEGEKFIQINHIKFMNFGKGMSKFLSDCESLSYDLKKKKYKRRDYLKVVDQYNKCE